MLILASASPARAKLLTEAGFHFDVIPTDIDEEIFKQTITDPETLVKELAAAKASACYKLVPLRSQLTPFTILAADTVVVLDGAIIGKPRDRAHAKEIITSLAGHTHTVWTGVCLITLSSSLVPRRSRRLFADHASVTFKPMTDNQIEMYLDTNEWVDKAGGYQVRKSIRQYVDHIAGDESTVLGLPMTKIQQEIP